MYVQYNTVPDQQLGLQVTSTRESNVIKAFPIYLVPICRSQSVAKGENKLM